MKTSFEVRNITESEFHDLKPGDIVYLIVGGFPSQCEVVNAPFWNSDADEPDWEVETTRGFADMNSLYITITEAVETCPYCDSENTYPNWDVKKQGYIAKCEFCGREIFLCDECMHSDDNKEMRCDWYRNGNEGRCFRGVKKMENDSCEIW